MQPGGRHYFLGRVRPWSCQPGSRWERLASPGSMGGFPCNVAAAVQHRHRRARARVAVSRREPREPTRSINVQRQRLAGHHHVLRQPGKRIDVAQSKQYEAQTWQPVGTGCEAKVVGPAAATQRVTFQPGGGANGGAGAPSVRPRKGRGFLDPRYLDEEFGARPRPLLPERREEP